MTRPAGSVLRLDFSPIQRGTITPQGFYRFDAVLGRVGVLKYRTADGKTVRELRPPEEVFALDSMQSAWGAIVTDKHPPREDAFITPANVKKYQVGWCGDSVRRDGDLIRGSVVVQDGETIALIASGERKEISPGYLVTRYDASPGRWNGKDYGPHVLDGEEYDCIQRGIVYNSIGIGPKGWGRQGSAVALQLDSMDLGAGMMLMPEPKLGDFLKQQMLIKGMSLIDLAVATGIIRPADTDYEGEEKDPLLRQESTHRRTSILEDILSGYTDRPSDEQLSALAEALDVPIDSLIQRLPMELQKLDATEEPASGTRQLTLEINEMALELMTLKLDGVDVEIPKATLPLVQRALADRDAKITTLEAAATKHVADLSAVQARLDGVTEQLGKAKADAEAAPAKVRAEIQARTNLEQQAHAVLGDAVKLDGLTDRQVREAVIKHASPAVVLDGKDEAYVTARYDHAIETTPKQTATSQAFNAAFPTGPQPRVRQDSHDDFSRETNPLAERAAMIERNQSAARPKGN